MQLLCMRSCTLNCFVAFCRSPRTSLGHSVLCCAVLCCAVLCCAVTTGSAFKVEYKAVTGLGKSALTRLYRPHSQPQIKLKKKKKHVV